MTTKIKIIVDSNVVHNPHFQLNDTEFNEEIEKVKSRIINTESEINGLSKVRYHFQKVEIVKVEESEHTFIQTDNPNVEEIRFGEEVTLRRTFDPDEPEEIWELDSHVNRTVYRGAVIPEHMVQSMIELVIKNENLK